MIVAVILAGGEATRLDGIDKCLVELDGRPVLAHLLDRLRPTVAATALSANGDPARFRPFGLPVLPDRLRRIGPLGGVARGLEWAEALGAEAMLTVPGDTPFVPSDLAARLEPAPAMARSGGRAHPAVALWPVGWRALLDRHLAALPADAPRRALGVRAFSEANGMREVAFAAVACDPFFNLNTPDDVLRLRDFRA